MYNNVDGFKVSRLKSPPDDDDDDEIKIPRALFEGLMYNKTMLKYQSRSLKIIYFNNLRKEGP